MNVISIINNKGGVGKTPISINLAAGLAHAGFKTGLIDFDSQDQASLGFIFDRTSDLRSCLDKEKTLTIDDFCKTKEENLWILPNLGDLTDKFFLQKGVLSGRETQVLSRILKDCKDFDYIIIDCNPALDVQALNALCASTHMIIPTTLEFSKIDGTVKFMEKVTPQWQNINPALQLLGILITKYTFHNYIFKNDMEKNLTRFFGKENIMDTKIRQNPDFDRILAMNQTFFNAPMHSQSIRKGLNDFLDLTKEVINKTTKTICIKK
jgi:chromosome partitioning protein